MSKSDRTYGLKIRQGLLLDFLLSVILIFLIQFYSSIGLVFQNKNIFFLCLLFAPAYFFFYGEHRSIIVRGSASYTIGGLGHTRRHIVKFLALKFCFLGIVIAIADPVFGEQDTLVTVMISQL